MTRPVETFKYEHQSKSKIKSVLFEKKLEFFENKATRKTKDKEEKKKFLEKLTSVRQLLEEKRKALQDDEDTEKEKSSDKAGKVLNKSISDKDDVEVYSCEDSAEEISGPLDDLPVGYNAGFEIENEQDGETIESAVDSDDNESEEEADSDDCIFDSELFDASEMIDRYNLQNPRK